jgi:hypothetical protein
MDAHVINVAKRTDRWEQFTAAWKDTGLNIIREDALVPDGRTIRNVYDAVFLKHREILEAALARGEKYCLIMEDDAIPCKDWEKRFKHVRDYLNLRDDWDIFNGGMLSMRDCVHKIVRIVDEDLTTLVVSSVRGCMAQFVYFNVAAALKKMEAWEADGCPEFDGWYPHKLLCVASVPFIAVQSDGFSDSSNDKREWEQRFKFEEQSMLYAMREFLSDAAPASSEIPKSAVEPEPLTLT